LELSKQLYVKTTKGIRMRKLKLISSILIIALFSFGLTAKGTWKIKKNYSYKGTSSVHVSGPEGFTFKVKTKNQEKEEEVPGIIELYNTNTYGKITIVAPNGDTWTKRLQIKSRKELKIDFDYKAAKKVVKKVVKRARLVKGYLYNSYSKCKGKYYKYTQLDAYIFTSKNARGYAKKFTISYKKPRVYAKLKPGSYWAQYSYRYWDGYKKKWSKTLKTSKKNPRLKFNVIKGKKWSHGFGCGRG